MSPLPSVAALTVVKDESEMLPRWISHYGERLGLDHLVVLDDASVDGSTDGVATDGIEVRRVTLPGGIEFERARIRMANHTAAELLERFDWVVFTDADELLVVDPRRHDSYRHLLASTEQPVLAPVGLNVVHRPRAETELDLGRPILEQRGFAYLTQMMSKPSTKRVAARWRLASHGIASPYEVRRDLFCVHLKFADVDRLRATTTHRRELNEQDGRGGGSWKKNGMTRRFRNRMGATDFDAAEVFDPAAVDVAALSIPIKNGGGWRTPKTSQLRDLRESPVLRLPAWLRATV